MTALQKIALGTAPAGTDGDTFRTASTRMNANVDVLDTQAALSSTTTITSPSALTIANVGRRTSISLTAAGTINLPAANTCAADQVLFLRNIGAYVVNLAPSAGSVDSVTSTTLNPNETVAFETNGSNLWRPLWRSKNSNNEVVNGTLTVAGGIAGDLPVSGQISASNPPNLLMNGSAEFGMLGWSSAYFDAATDATAGNATYFTNSVAMTGSAIYDYSGFVPVNAGEAVSVQGLLDTSGMTAGAANVGVEFRDDSNNVVGTVVLVPTYGKSAAFYANTGIAPAEATRMRFRLGASGSPVGPVGAVKYSSLKYAVSPAPSMYSQEASIAYLSGSPNFSGTVTAANATVAGTVALGGQLVFTNNAGIKGSLGTFDAKAGNVGEYLEVVGIQSGGMGTATMYPLSQLQLTPGDWDVDGLVEFSFTGAFNAMVAALDPASGSNPGFPYTATSIFATQSAAAIVSLSPPPRRFKVSVNTVVYLNAQGNYSSGALTSRAWIRARRVQ